MRGALSDRTLLDNYWTEASGCLNRLLISEAGRDLCDDDVRRKLQARAISVYALGESGAGTSSLLAALVENSEKEFASSASLVGTTCEQSVRMTSGLSFIDSPGFRLPVQKEWSPMSWIRDAAAWRKTLAFLRTRLLEKEPPDVVLYAHKAGTRVVPERMTEVLEIAHKRAQVPTILALTDVCSVTDVELEEIRTCIRQVLDGLGTNNCGNKVHLVEVNSSDKTVRQHRFKVTGLTDLTATILNAIEPADVLRFVRRRTWFNGKDKIEDLTTGDEPSKKRPRIECKVEDPA
jgi:predicted GTPase